MDKIKNLRYSNKTIRFYLDKIIIHLFKSKTDIGPMATYVFRSETKIISDNISG